MRLVYSLTGASLMRHAAIQYLAASPHHISRDIWGSIASLHSRCWRWKAGLSDAALRSAFAVLKGVCATHVLEVSAPQITIELPSRCFGVREGQQRMCQAGLLNRP